MPYDVVPDLPIGSLLVIEVETRSFVVRRLTEHRWTRPVQVDARRAEAQMRLYDPDAATAVHNAAGDDLLIAEYTDDDGGTIFAVRLPCANQSLHVPGCGPISSDELRELVDRWARDTGAEPSAFAVM